MKRLLLFFTFIFGSLTGFSLAFERNVDCGLAPVTGPCRAYITRYYYESHESSCKEFVFGGCGGNPNNFANMAECNRACANSKATPYQQLATTTSDPIEARAQKWSCFLPSDAGDCDQFRGFFSQQQKYSFNATTGMCQSFDYCGTGGNANRYDTNLDCMFACQPGFQGTASPLSTDLPPTVTTSVPETSSSSTPNFHPDSDCGRPAKPGQCTNFARRFFYEARTQTCKTFVYGGCGGNANNFASLEDCYKACFNSKPHKSQPQLLVQKAATPPQSPAQSQDMPNCYLPVHSGDCPDSDSFVGELKYFFNASANECQMFFYCGAGGNSNRFQDETQCQFSCSFVTTNEQTTPSTTTSRPSKKTTKTTPKMTTKTRTTPVKTTRTTTTTTTTTATATDTPTIGTTKVTKQPRNIALNARTMTADSSSVCELAMDNGDCEVLNNGNVDDGYKYYFDTAKGDCELFWYCGRGGNDNRFDRKAACKRTCMPNAPITEQPTTVTMRMTTASLTIDGFRLVRNNCGQLFSIGTKNSADECATICKLYNGCQAFAFNAQKGDCVVENRCSESTPAKDGYLIWRRS